MSGPVNWLGGKAVTEPPTPYLRWVSCSRTRVLVMIQAETTTRPMSNPWSLGPRSEISTLDYRHQILLDRCWRCWRYVTALHHYPKFIRSFSATSSSPPLIPPSFRALPHTLRTHIRHRRRPGSRCSRHRYTSHTLTNST